MACTGSSDSDGSSTSPDGAGAPVSASLRSRADAFAEAEAIPSRVEAGGPACALAAWSETTITPTARAAVRTAMPRTAAVHKVVAMTD
jgi:hypothetical protein